jgi:two-component system OmpR family response regulator
MKENTMPTAISPGGASCGVPLDELGPAANPGRAAANVMQYTLLVATSDDDRRAFLAAQLDADGHTVHEATTVAGTVAKLSCHAIDVLILGDLQHPADVPALLCAVRSGGHRRIHPGQAIITLGAGDELTSLRAYERGSDHHLPDSTTYVLLRAVIHAVARRALHASTGRHLDVAGIHIDLAARSVDVAGTVVSLSRRDFELLVTFATDPLRVFSKHQLARRVWRGEHVNERTVDSHVYHLRTRLTQAGATAVLVNKWGHGWSLTTEQ